MFAGRFFHEILRVFHTAKGVFAPICEHDKLYVYLIISRKNSEKKNKLFFSWKKNNPNKELKI